VIDVKDGEIRRLVIGPETFGVVPAGIETLRGGDARANAAIVEGILKGERGPRRDVVLMNAAAALMVSGAAVSLSEGFRQASDSIDSGKALRTLQALREISG
jgi:anthranilate phosphoribosyltransferase